jgi:PAS domain S-box-containing protein
MKSLNPPEGHLQLAQASWMAQNARAFPSCPQQKSVNYLTFQMAIALNNARAYQQLQQDSQHNRRLFEAASDAIILHSEREVLDCNPAALDLFGMTREEFLANTPGQLSPQYQPDGIESVIGVREIFVILMSQGRHRFEWVHQRRNGETFWAEIAMTLLEEGNQKLIHCIVRDISDRKEAAVELEKSNDQLAFANLQLQRATRLKDEFLANMSHELRTPLNAILGLSEALSDEVFGTINDRQKKSIATIERSGNHLLSLINDILDLSKIVAGKIDLELSPISIAQLCHSSLAFVKQQAHQKQIHLDVQISPQAGIVLLDERRMQQVLINLLNNAVKFTPNNGKITLTVSRDSRCEGELSISIQDTGIGISEADQKKLFEPFVQIDSRLNRKYEGTGLGLALVKQIVELHNGSVKLHSQPDVGSCFTVCLPAAALCSSFMPSVSQLAHSEPEAVSANELQKPLLMLVEDNEANIQTISSYLVAKGYELIVAQSGQEALDLTQQHQPQLILMDIQMPGMDGLETIQRLRRQAKTSQIPIIALTALAMTGDRERCLAGGASDYLTKPVRLKELNQTIQQWLNPQEVSTKPDLN